MTIGLTTAMRTSRIQVILDALDAGVGTFATMALYGGGAGRPATGAAVTTQTLLGTITLSNPSATVLNGVLTFNAFTDDSSADANGTIEWARFFDTDGGFVADMGCGIAASGEEIIFNTLTVSLGGIIQVLSGSLTEGNA